MIRECLAVQTGLRSLGYLPDNLSIFIDKESQIFVLLETEERNLGVKIGEISEWETDKFMGDWEFAADAWNENRIIDSQFLLNTSKVFNSWDDFLKLLEKAKITVPGPELRN